MSAKRPAQRHEMAVAWPGRPPERQVSLLTAYGDPDGDTAMARTVSLPAAAAGMLLLEGRLRSPGVQVPTRRESCETILDELETLGIRFREWSAPLGSEPVFAPARSST